MAGDESEIRMALRQALEGLYGPRFLGALLFGARARPAAHPSSGYDVAVFLHDLLEEGAEIEALKALAGEVRERTGIEVQFLAFAPPDRARPTPELLAVLEDGVAL